LLKPASQTQPALRQRIRETTVQAIFSAAEEVFASKGLHGAHMGEIAALAGVAVGTLYNHFADRDALLAGLLEARRTELLARIDEELEVGPVDGKRPMFRDRLRAFLHAVLAHKEAHRRFFQILMQGEIVRYQATFPSACHVPNATMHEMFARLDKLMRQGVREKALRPDIIDLAPVLLMGMVRAMMIRETLVKGATGDLVSETDRLLTFFLQGAGS
jgi:AcrR family transcriptional regulator